MGLEVKRNSRNNVVAILLRRKALVRLLGAGKLILARVGEVFKLESVNISKHHGISSPGVGRKEERGRRSNTMVPGVHVTFISL
jgi:hypothetical protein